MSYYRKKGSTLYPTDKDSYEIHSSLPVGTYLIGFDPMAGFYLDMMDDFGISGKIYGKTPTQADRILETFSKRPATTGVLLSGEKGSGKTLLSKLISKKAATQGISTIIVNNSYCGDHFNTFIQSIDEPTVIIFDEFEKVYDADDQEKILTLLDGVFTSKKLFMLTVNDKYKVNTNMRNRPGRIFYMIEYKGLDAAFIAEYCEDNLLNKLYIQQVCRMTMLFDSFNFDMLKALVEEMNRYNESPAQAMEMLNAKPFEAGTTMHNAEIIYHGNVVPTNLIYPSRIRGNPIAQACLEFTINLEPDNEDVPVIEFEVTPEHLKKIDPDQGIFTYVVNEGTPDMTVVKLSREMFVSRSGNWMSAIDDVY